MIFGPYIGTIKWKTTRTKPVPVVDDIIEIPSELVQVQEDVIFSDGTCWVFGLGFFVFFNLTQPNKTPRVCVFSALVAQAGKPPKIVKI